MEVLRTNFDSENITSKLNFIFNNLPENISTIEKVRWIYIKMGEIFSYDYRIVNDVDLAKKIVNINDSYISRFQTCSQISLLFKEMMSFLVPECKTEIIERKIQRRGNFEVEHIANSVILPSGEKYLLDLTIDLFLIQSGCKTKNFGYDSDFGGDFDIIPSIDCQKMDNNLNLINQNQYTDSEINIVKELINCKDFSGFSENEKFEFKIRELQKLNKSFFGHHESKMYIDKLIKEILNVNSFEYNLNYLTNEDYHICTCFNFKDHGVDEWYILDNVFGFTKTSKEMIKNMLESGWITKSESLENIIFPVEQPKR